jgi:hypothetical protein
MIEVDGIDRKSGQKKRHQVEAQPPQQVTRHTPHITHADCAGEGSVAGVAPPAAVRPTHRRSQQNCNTFTMYGPHNTLHVDDLARNFALNPANGIKIKAYREDMCALPLNPNIIPS